MYGEKGQEHFNVLGVMCVTLVVHALVLVNNDSNMHGDEIKIKK